jgi:putative acetyltransferase
MIKELDDFYAKEVMDIWLKTNISAHSFIPEQYWLKNYDVVKNEYIPVSKTFIYEEDSRVKAFISIVNSEFVGALFVLKDCQGQGIGKKLLNYCKELYSSLELCVYQENINAVNFYKSCDFVIVKEQINEDSGYMEYLMRWRR